MPKGSGGEPSWWSSGEVPDELPTWARRGLEESPTELAPSAPVTDPGRHRRRRGAAAVGASTSGRLRGWALAAASVAAAAAVVPAAISTLANNGENTALPRVGTFPVVAPGDLPGQSLPPASRPGSGTEDPSADPGAPADASVLPPLDDPTIAIAQPPRSATVTPRALARDDDETTSTTTSRPTTGTSTADDDEDEDEGGNTETPTTRGDDDDDSGDGGSSGSTPPSSSGSAGGSRGSESRGSDESGSRRSGNSLVGEVADAAGDTVRGVGRTVNGLVG